MDHQKPINARLLAMKVLTQVDPKRSYAAPVLSDLLYQTNERQRATDLVFGTLRNQTAIDIVIIKLAGCEPKRISTKLLNVIRIAVYELIYSPETAEYAIVNEAVNNTKAIGGKKQVGFVNATLRQITRHITNRQTSFSEANAQKILPQTPSVGCEFDTCILPEPKASPADYLSTAFSLPKWLVNTWLTEFEYQKTKQICSASNRRPSVYIRPNTLKATAQQLAEKFRQADIDSEIVPGKSMIKIKSPSAITQLPGFAEGLFSVQDITAAKAVELLNPKPGWAILDLCAAPGGKTAQLAQATGDSAKIIATDIDSKRLEMVTENISRLGISSVSVVEYEKLEQKVSEIGLFDAVLLDVPCSNTGVLAKKPEARFRINQKAVRKLTKIQSQLLETATAMTKPRGKICYSTCSIQQAENSGLVKKFLQKNCQLKLKSELLILPLLQEFDHDGSYTAIIAKNVKQRMYNQSLRLKIKQF